MMTAKEVREIRFRLQLSQAQLAERLKVTKNTVWRWENGAASPSAMHEYGLRLLQEANNGSK